MSIYNPGFSLEHFDSKVGGAKKRRSSKGKSKKSKRSASKHKNGGAKKRHQSKSKSKKSKRSKKSQHHVSHMLPF
jgi:hypothetical protein